MTGTVPDIAAMQRRLEDDGRLTGFRSACGFVSATWGLRCPRCGDAWQPTELGTEGALVSFTVQTVPSEEFLNDAPYAYVIVDLDGGGRVTGWIAGVRSDAELSVGARVRRQAGYRPGLQFVPVGPATSGTERR